MPVLSSRPPRQTEKAAKCPEPLCPTRVLPPLGRRDPSPERTLLLRLRSYRLIRRSRWALSSFGFWPRLRVLAGCYQSPLPTAASRRYLQQSVLGCWIPYPGGTPCALTCYFHDVIGLPQVKNGSASRICPATYDFSQGSFRGCRYFVMFRPPSLLAPRIVPTAANTPAGQLGLLRPSISCFVASTRPGYANRLNTSE